MLPDKNLRKAICTYYLWFLEDDKDRDDEQKIIEGGPKLMTGPGIVTVDMVRDRQDDKPLDAAAFKSEFSPFDVTQKLFKEEIGEYDKKHCDTSDLRSMGTRTKLVWSWYNALSPSVLEELRLVADKWNQEGPHSDAKDRYHSRHQMKIMEDFIKMAGRTLMIEGRGKYLERPSEHHEDRSDEDDKKRPDLTVQVNDEGYPCLSTGFESLILKNQQKVIWQVFQKSYVLNTNHPQAAVPWGHITQDPDQYLDMDCMAQNVVIKDPSHLQKEAISMIYSLWKSCANHNKPIVQFVRYKEGDFYDSLAKRADVLKKAAQADLSSDEEEDLAMYHNYTPSLSNSCPKLHMNGDWLLATVQKLSNTLSSVALEELENYIIKSHGLGMIVVLELGLLLLDEAGDDVSQYLGDSILGIQVGEKIDAMLPDGNENLITVSEEVHMRCLENNRQVKERREVERARVVEEKKVAEEERVVEEKRLAEMSRMAEEKRLAEEKRVAESPQRVKKASNTNTGGKGKGKRSATDLNDSAMKKVKTSAPPDPPCCSARERVASKKYKD
ncbi:hypothetical protein BDR05DRAFT_949041 [Suillus weaverae]|nr:hypothetical protein BDR05DRAFT_949041 [Suillus weaverae]